MLSLTNNIKASHMTQRKEILRAEVYLALRIKTQLDSGKSNQKQSLFETHAGDLLRGNEQINSESLSDFEGCPQTVRTYAAALRKFAAHLVLEDNIDDFRKTAALNIARTAFAAANRKANKNPASTLE